jgi:NitT/TauT family transport system permease protein
VEWGSWESFNDSMACIWPILFNVITGIKVVDPALERSARALNISHFQSFTQILLPSVGPWIYTGLSTGVEISFFMVVAAEMIGTSAGLGWLVHNAGMNNKVVWIYSAAVLIMLWEYYYKMVLRYNIR